MDGEQRNSPYVNITTCQQYLHVADNLQLKALIISMTIIHVINKAAHNKTINLAIK